MTGISPNTPAVPVADPNKPHIILVGLPGAGKSTVGGMVAAKLRRPFLDFDTEIERRQGKPIAQIFGELGEAGFRDLERKLTEEMKAQGGMVLSPGGGWIGDPDVVALLRPPAVLIYLRVRPETALKRLQGAVGSRPLLNRPDPLAEINKLFEQRRMAYQTADHEIGAELLTAAQVTSQILEKLQPK